jgi:acyl-CoA thioesterase II
VGPGTYDLAMGDLGIDTAVEGSDGTYTASLSSDWEIWGPMGGYVASTALRAAGAHTSFGRPANLAGHFLGVAAFGTVDIVTTTLRKAKKAESMRVSISQEGRPVFEALVWAVADDIAGLNHTAVEPPSDAGVPIEHRTVLERVEAMGRDPEPIYPFWENFEERPVDWVDDWEHRTPDAPTWTAWLRFVPEPDTSDPWVDASRLLVLVDIGSWPSVVRQHVDTAGLYAPSIDLACHFHRFRPASSHLLVHGTSPSGADGLVTSHQSVWSDDGTFLASGISQLLCRPTP